MPKNVSETTFEGKEKTRKFEIFVFAYYKGWDWGSGFSVSCLVQIDSTKLSKRKSHPLLNASVTNQLDASVMFLPACLIILTFEKYEVGFEQN